MRTKKIVKNILATLPLFLMSMSLCNTNVVLAIRVKSTTLTNTNDKTKSEREIKPKKIDIEKKEMLQKTSKPQQTEKSALCGLTNIGNSCYFNAALQQIYANKGLKNAIAMHDWNKKTQPTLTALDSLFMEMLCTKFNGQEVVDSSFMQKFNKDLGEIHRRTQEDSSELYMNLMDKCSNEGLKFNNFKVKTETIIYDSSGENQILEPTSADNDVLTLNVENITSSGFKSLADYLKKGIVSSDDISGYNYEGKKINAKKIEKIISYPDTLILNLNRTGMNYRTGSKYKILSKLLIDEVITINEHKYKLKAVTVHWGSNSNRGHYINYVCDKNGEWFKISDSSVTPCTYAEAANDIKTNGTMATYEKINS